jgi:hypothetical protein
MPVTMICPNLACRRTVTAPDSARGKVVRCGQCQQPFLVPSRDGPEPPPPEPADGKKQKKG